jgi:hypothetical protein
VASWGQQPEEKRRRDDVRDGSSVTLPVETAASDSGNMHGQRRWCARTKARLSDSGGQLQTWVPVRTIFMAWVRRVAVSARPGDPAWRMASQVETVLYRADPARIERS